MSDKKPLFVTADQADQAYRDGEVIQHRTTAGNTFRNISQPNVSVREGFDRRDYDFFRPGEQIPTKDVDIIGACMQAYDRIGIVRNIIDMMSEFACQGIDLVHPNPRIEKFFKEWFNKVNGKERTERILNMLFRAGNVVIKRSTARFADEDAAALHHPRAAAFAKQTLHRNGHFQRRIACLGMQGSQQPRAARTQHQNVRAAPRDLGWHHAAPSFSSTAWRRRAASSFTLAKRLPPWLSIATNKGPKPLMRNL